MYIAITIFAFIAAIFLILIVLVQNSKGGGLASGFSASNQVMGVRKTTDFLEKATWTIAAVVVFLSVVSSAFLSDNTDAVKESIIKEEVAGAVAVDPNLVSPNFEGQSEQTAPAATSTAPAADGTVPAEPAAKK